MDNRNWIKFFDIDHHKNYLTFDKLIAGDLKRISNYPEHLRRGVITVRCRYSNGTDRAVVAYDIAGVPQCEVGSPGIILLPRKILDHFQDTSAVTEGEWELFRVCEPAWAKRMEEVSFREAAQHIELFLKGRVMVAPDGILWMGPQDGK